MVDACPLMTRALKIREFKVVQRATMRRHDNETHARTAKSATFWCKRITIGIIVRTEWQNIDLVTIITQTQNTLSR